MGKCRELKISVVGLMMEKELSEEGPNLSLVVSKMLHIWIPILFWAFSTFNHYIHKAKIVLFPWYR